MAESWVGGDIVGLQTMAGVMKPAPGMIDGVVKELSARVDTLASDANWSGDAADEFRKLWTQNSIQVGGIGVVVAQFGEAVGTLGDELQHVEALLYNAAQDAAGRGAQIAPDGRPGILVIQGNPADPVAAAASEAQSDYTVMYDESMQLAQHYRMKAAGDLSALIDLVEPPDKVLPWDQRVTIADFLRALYVIPNEKNTGLLRTVTASISGAQDTLRDARKEWKVERDAYADKGLKLPADNPAQIRRLSELSDINGLRNSLAAAESGRGELALSKVLNTKLSDVEKMIPTMGGILPKGLEFLKEIPVVDIAASVLIGEIQAQDDEDKGWSGTEARLKDYGAAAVGLAAGAATIAVVTAVGASAPVSLTAVGVGLVVVGVGDLTYQGFHEHWAEDIDDRGVLSGLGHGALNVGSNTGADMRDIWNGAVDGGKSIWNSIF